MKFLLEPNHKRCYNHNLSHEKYALDGGISTNSTLKSIVDSKTSPWGTCYNTKEDWKITVKGYEHEVPLGAHKANKFDVATLYLILRKMSLSKGEIVQIIGRKPELFNKGPCVIIFMQPPVMIKMICPC